MGVNVTAETYQLTQHRPFLAVDAKTNLHRPFFSSFLLGRNFQPHHALYIPFIYSYLKSYWRHKIKNININTNHNFCVFSMGKNDFKRSVIAVAVALLAMVHVSVSVPFIVLHGVSAECSSGRDANFTQLLTKLSGSPGFCLEIGNGKDDSWFMPLTRQAEIACEKVKEMKELRQGYNIVGRSQGNLVARGLIEFCDGGPPVYNYISLAGPHAGISSVPMCGSGVLCDIADVLIKDDIYSDFIQDNLAPSGYIKIPTDIPKYLKSSKYLPKLNNEIPNQRNSTYKDRFTSLQNLVLVMFEDDKVIVPKESSLFWFYPDGETEHLLSANQTKLYTEDWIGLKTLDVAGKVKFVSVAGEHIRMAEPDVVKHVVPYLKNQPSSIQRLNRKTKELLHP